MPVKKTKTTKKSSAAHAPKKRFHHHHFPMIPLGSWILFWFFVLVTVLLSTICFTNVLDTTGRYATSTATNGSLATQRVLEAKVAELQGQVSSEGQPEGRVLLAVRGATIPGACDVWATSTADITISYLYPVQNENVRMSLPYSLAWGNEKYALTPHEFIESMKSNLFFGPAIEEPSAGGNCVLARDSWISVDTEIPSVNEVRRLVTTQQGEAEEPATNLQERTINGILVLSYTQVINGDEYKQWHGFGRSYHYFIQSQGWLTDAEAIKIIQSLKVVK